MSNTATILIGDAFFKRHTDHILGSTHETTNRFGEPVVEVRGKLEDALAVMPNLPKPVRYPMRPAPQGSKKPDYEQDTIERAIQETEEHQAPPDTAGLDLMPMDALLEQFHPDVSEDDLQLWAYYQRGRIMSETQVLRNDNGWSRYVVPLAKIKEKRKEWLQAGKIVYDGHEWIPSYLYYSGNIYQKLEEQQTRKDTIVAEIGKEAWERQLKNLEAAKPTYLTIDAAEGSELYISPVDPIVDEFTVIELADGTSIFEYPRTLLDVFKEYLRDLPRDAFEHGSDYMDVIDHFLNHERFPNDTPVQAKITRKRRAQQDGMMLFERFLKEKLTDEDKERLEYQWNSTFNAFQEPDYNKIPVGLEINRWFKNGPISPRPALWEGVKFLTTNGSGIVAFDVGVGKTMTAILAMAQALYTGQAKRPLVVVPNPTYAKWIAETVGIYDTSENVVSHGILPQYKNRVNDYYNLGKKYIDKIKNQPPQDYSITFITYEGLEALGFSRSLQDELSMELFTILNQGLDKRDREKMREKVDEMLGSTVAGSEINIDDLGFDYIVVDEAHNFKKVFTRVKGRTNSEDKDAKRGKNPYELSSGKPSTRGLKLFMISQYILRRNHMRNVVLLTATPFTNSPLEIYSMLALVAYQELEERGINNITDFFDKFINETYELKINAKGKIVNDAVIKSFNNRIVLQNIIFNYIIHKTGEEANVPRPKKVVYPLHKDGDGILLPHDKQVETALPPTPEQELWMQEIAAFANGQKGNKIEHYIPASMEKDGDIPGRVLIALNLQQSLTLSPYLMSVGGNPFFGSNPSYQEFIDSSPKLRYVMEAIQTTREWHDKRGEEYSGQVIYTDRGKDFFPLIKEYLVKEIGYRPTEVQLIKSGMSQKRKEKVKEDFLAGKVKVIIGSSTIKEGIDLQNKATVLYNCNLDWNPTDVQQVEGRIWRQGNQHSHVRIVVPMIENSVDVFLFQKLDEKTSRINDIWYRSGKGNVLDVDQLNPEELKMSLMTNPEEAARSQIDMEVEKLDMEIKALESQRDSLSRAESDIRANKEAEKELTTLYTEEALPDIKGEAEQLQRQLKGRMSNTDRQRMETRLRVLQKKLKLEGRQKEFAVLKAYVSKLTRKSNPAYDYRPFRLLREVNDQLKRHQRLQNISENILSRYKLTIEDDLKPLVNQLGEQLTELYNRREKLTSDRYLQQKTRELREERNEKQKFSQPVEVRVEEFRKHNHLLSCMRDIHECKLCPKEVVEAQSTEKTYPEPRNPHWNEGQEPDTRPGHYYITAIFDKQVSFLAGPFVDDHAKALKYVYEAKERAEELDSKADFASYGTARKEKTSRKIGLLNSYLNDTFGLNLPLYADDIPKDDAVSKELAQVAQDISELKEILDLVTADEKAKIQEDLAALNDLHEILNKQTANA